LESLFVQYKLALESGDDWDGSGGPRGLSGRLGRGGPGLDGDIGKYTRYAGRVAERGRERCVQPIQLGESDRVL
jgi:hypothetical protein